MRIGRCRANYSSTSSKQAGWQAGQRPGHRGMAQHVPAAASWGGASPVISLTQGSRTTRPRSRIWVQRMSHVSTTATPSSRPQRLVDTRAGWRGGEAGDLGVSAAGCSVLEAAGCQPGTCAHVDALSHTTASMHLLSIHALKARKDVVPAPPPLPLPPFPPTPLESPQVQHIAQRCALRRRPACQVGQGVALHRSGLVRLAAQLHSQHGLLRMCHELNSQGPGGLRVGPGGQAGKHTSTQAGRARGERQGARVALKQASALKWGMAPSLRARLLSAAQGSTASVAPGQAGCPPAS